MCSRLVWWQSIHKESNDKDVAAELTIEADEESFVIVLQHGGNDVTCKRSIMENSRMAATTATANY